MQEEGLSRSESCQSSVLTGKNYGHSDTDRVVEELDSKRWKGPGTNFNTVTIGPDLYFYRDSTGNEVDLLIAQGQSILPVEIKSSSTFTPSFIKGIASLKKQLGIGRTGPMADVDGFFAILLWREYKNRQNRKALETLLSYNIQDAVNLES